MKRRTFIKETTTVFTGLGLSAVSCNQTQIKKVIQLLRYTLLWIKKKCLFIVMLSKKK